MQPPNLCIQFQRGFCSYGNNCRFLHQSFGTYAQGGGRFGEARWTQAQGRGARGGGRYFHESHFQVSATASHSAPRLVQAREWSAPLNDANPLQQGASFNFRFMSWNILAAELVGQRPAQRSVVQASLLLVALVVVNPSLLALNPRPRHAVASASRMTAWGDVGAKDCIRRASTSKSSTCN
jgi:hypothetical protein